MVVVLFPNTAEVVAGSLESDGLEEELEFGCGELQATHLTLVGLFCTMQTSQSQEPAGALNRSPNPVEAEGAVVTAGVCWKVTSGPGELRLTGEAKPGALRRSSTLPCFKTLAGLKGPSNSSVLSLEVVFTAPIKGVSIFPFDTDVPARATGTLKVKPADGEKEGGLAAVAMTMGEEKVKGSQGGVDTVGGSFSEAGSLAGVTAVAVGVTQVVIGGLEKVKVGRLKALMGREIAGRSGTSAISSSSERLEEGRVLVLSLFILPPPEVVALTTGVLDRG